MHDLPVVTAVENGAVWNVIVTDHPFSTQHGHTFRKGQPAIVDFSLSLAAALDRAYAFLYVLNGLEDDADLSSHDIKLLPLDPSPVPLGGHNRITATGKQYTAYDTTRVYISPDAWERLTRQKIQYGYRGTAAWQGITKYLIALATANPTPDDWQDTRPLSLKDMDEVQMSFNKLPIWSASFLDTTPLEHGQRRRQQRNLNSQDVAKLVEIWLPVADFFLIAPYRNGEIGARSRVLAMIEAIGCGYLTPKNKPQYNPLEAKRVRPARDKVGGIVW